MYQKMGGSERLLQVTAKTACADEVRDQSLYYRELMKLTPFSQVMEEILDGRESSIFEDTCRPPKETRFGDPYDIEVAMEEVQYILTRLPRLVFQAREAMELHAEADSDKDLIERIVALFNHDASSFVERTLSAHSRVIKDPDGFKTSPMGASMEFSSVRAFYVAAWYYFSQIIICSLMQRLDEMHAGGMALLNIPAARARDVAAASSLAMCVDCTLKPSRSRPFVALAILGPLQLSSGTWFRLQKRQPSSQTLDYMQAVSMVDWSLGKAHIIEDMWQSAPATIERMTLMTDMFAGGPFVPKRGL